MNTIHTVAGISLWMWCAGGGMATAAERDGYPPARILGEALGDAVKPLPHEGQLVDGLGLDVAWKFRPATAGSGAPELVLRFKFTNASPKPIWLNLYDGRLTPTRLAPEAAFRVTASPPKPHGRRAPTREDVIRIPAGKTHTITREMWCESMEVHQGKLVAGRVVSDPDHQSYSYEFLRSGKYIFVFGFLSNGTKPYPLPDPELEQVEFWKGEVYTKPQRLEYVRFLDPGQQIDFGEGYSEADGIPVGFVAAAEVPREPLAKSFPKEPPGRLVVAAGKPFVVYGRFPGVKKWPDEFLVRRISYENNTIRARVDYVRRVFVKNKSDSQPEIATLFWKLPPLDPGDYRLEVLFSEFTREDNAEKSKPLARGLDPTFKPVKIELRVQQE